MRLSAYVLLADPCFLAASISSYYELVDTIVASHDEAHLGWGGDPIDVESCLREVRAADPDHKVRIVTGKYRANDGHRLRQETRQRQEALNIASEYGDWVLQIDGDEIIPDSGVFHDQLGWAEESGCDGLDFPSLWLFCRVGSNRYLASSDRFYRLVSGFPGVLACRAHTELTHARQISGSRWRADIGPKSRDPWQPTCPVHAVVPTSSAVRHFSWARSPASMREKAQVSGHAKDFDWEVALRPWESAQTHPWRYLAGTPFRQRAARAPGARVRPVAIPDPPMLIADDAS